MSNAWVPRIWYAHLIIITTYKPPNALNAIGVCTDGMEWDGIGIGIGIGIGMGTLISYYNLNISRLRCIRMPECRLRRLSTGFCCCHCILALHICHCCSTATARWLFDWVLECVSDGGRWEVGGLATCVLGLSTKNNTPIRAKTTEYLAINNDSRSAW